MKWIYLRAINGEESSSKSPSTENLILNPNALFTFLNIKYSYQLYPTCTYKHTLSLLLAAEEKIEWGKCVILCVMSSVWGRGKRINNYEMRHH